MQITNRFSRSADTRILYFICEHFVLNHNCLSCIGFILGRFPNFKPINRQKLYKASTLCDPPTHKENLQRFQYPSCHFLKIFGTIQHFPNSMSRKSSSKFIFDSSLWINFSQVPIIILSNLYFRKGSFQIDTGIFVKGSDLMSTPEHIG